MSKSTKKRSYIVYALGEIILIVIGILIAVQIDEYYSQKQRKTLEKKYYLEIVTDLKKDSVHFQELKTTFQRYLDKYYLIYAKIKDQEIDIPLETYEWTMYNRVFTPITLNNHQNSVDIINDAKVRSSVNEYFARQLRAQDAFNEFSDLVREFSRPYFISNNAVSAEAVFHDDKYGFLPQGSLVKAEKIDELLKDDKLLQVITYLRISAGSVLSELKTIMAENESLINELVKASED